MTKKLDKNLQNAKNALTFVEQLTLKFKQDDAARI